MFNSDDILVSLETELDTINKEIEELKNQVQYISKHRKKDRYRGQDIYREWYWQNKDYYNNLINSTKDCYYCKKPMFRGEIRRDTKNNPIYDLDHPTLDHILPKSMFPQYANKLDNFVVICHKCNRKKGIKIESEVVSVINLLAQEAFKTIK